VTNSNDDMAPPSCKKCGQRTELQTVLPRFDRHPTNYIYRCPTCGTMEWIPESELGSRQHTPPLLRPDQPAPQQQEQPQKATPEKKDSND
jgi:NAD-dependent SIR2 family protein deacetylase